MRRDVFQAIADPTRRRIIHAVSQQTLTLNEVAAEFDMSRQAVAKHVKILTECGLVTVTVSGRERYCEARLEKLNEVDAWIDRYRRFWQARFDSMENYLNELQKNSKKKKHGKGKKK